MNVHVFNEQTDLAVSVIIIQEIAKQIVKAEKKQFDEVSIHLVDKETICKLHADFFNDPSPTDCISFPMDSPNEEGYKILGDVFVCPSIAIEYAGAHDEDPHLETTLYITHGILHLLGYDDLDERSEAKMRTAEKKHIKLLKLNKLILEKPLPS